MTNMQHTLRVWIDNEQLRQFVDHMESLGISVRTFQWRGDDDQIVWHGRTLFYASSPDKGLIALAKLTWGEDRLKPLLGKL